MKISRTVSELLSGHKYMVEMAMFNVQRVITPQADKPELHFMCSAHSLMRASHGVLHWCEVL